MSKEINVVEAFKDMLKNQYNRVQEHVKEFEISPQKFTNRISLLLILTLSVVVRLYPILKGWDPLIKAFDPQFQLRSADYILNNGLIAFFKWRDMFSWYPYGREVGSTMYIMVPLMVDFSYLVLNALGFKVSLQFAAFLVPVIFGTLGVLYIYRLASELISERAGLFAAIIMSITPAYLSRSIAGFVDNESIGVLLTVASFFYFSQALNHDDLRSAIKAGVALALLASSWGAFRFGYDLVALYALVLVMTGNYSARLLKQYSMTVGVASSLMILLPRISGGFLLDAEGLGPLGILLIMMVFGIIQNASRDLNPEQFRRLVISSFVVILALAIALAALLVSIGFLGKIGDKFISVLLPGDRNKLPLIDSVAEHQPLSWGSFYFNMNTMVFFIPIGIYEAIRKPTEKNLFILTLGLTSIYFSGSMIRLMLLLAPAAVLLTALAIDQLLISYGLIAHKRINKTSVRASRLRRTQKIGEVEIIITYFIILIFVGSIISNGLNAADQRFSSPELTPGQSPKDSFADWPQAFEWMKTHTSYKLWAQNSSEDRPGNPPIMLSWWDYGYYITSLGETASLVDNATTNSTQIGTVGTMLMWNTSASIKLMYKYNVQYILINSAGGLLNFGSDIGKSIWMIRISEQYTPEYGIVEEDYYTRNEGYMGKYADSTLFQLMAYKSPGMGDSPFVDRNGWSNTVADSLKDVNVLEIPPYFKEVFRSDGYLANPGTSVPGDFPFIRIYKVIYPDDIELQVAEFDQTMAKIRANMAEDNSS